MDNVSCNDGGSRLVVLELSHIKQLVTQLEVHLGESPDLCNCKRLASQIFSLTERSIGMITSSASSFNSAGRKRSAGGNADLASATPSPLSGVADAPFKTSNKKRKMMEKRAHKVRVSAGGGAGETPPVDDGHSWRKYGQKEILGAKHPRSYYRCTHRHSKGCMATKQVQRTDEDPELFDVFYLGTHTCCQTKTAAAVAAGQATQPPEHNSDAHGLLQSMSASLTVMTDGLAEAAAEPQGWSATAPFRFSSTPVSGGLAPEWSQFSAPSENWGVSPATSDSNHVALFPPFEAAAAGDAEVVSALVAAGTTPSVDMDDDFLNIFISSILCDPTQVADEQ